MTDTAIPPAVPVSLQAAQWAGLIRHLIGLAAGAGLLGATWAAVSTEQIENFLTAILTLAGVIGTVWPIVWSWRQKRNEADVSRATAVASAVASVEIGKPVTVSVEVTPKGRPDLVVATLISKTEAAIAAVPAPGVKPDPAPRPATM